MISLSYLKAESILLDLMSGFRQHGSVSSFQLLVPDWAVLLGPPIFLFDQ